MSRIETIRGQYRNRRSEGMRETGSRSAATSVGHA